MKMLSRDTPEDVTKDTRASMRLTKRNLDCRDTTRTSERAQCESFEKR